MKKLLHGKILLLFFTSVIIIFGMNSCSKYTFMPMGEKVVGEWSFEKVKFTKGYSLSKRDGLHDYINWHYIFTEDGLFYMQNTMTHQVIEGKWSITSRSVYNAATEIFDDIHDLHVSLYDPDTAQLEQFVWEVTGLSAKRMRATEYFSGETWYYVLRRE